MTRFPAFGNRIREFWKIFRSGPGSRSSSMSIASTNVSGFAKAETRFPVESIFLRPLSDRTRNLQSIVFRGAPLDHAERQDTASDRQEDCEEERDL